MSRPSLSRRVLGTIAGASLLVGLVPGVATAATPQPRDPSKFACPPDDVPDPEFSDDDASEGETTAEHEANIACIVWYELASGRTPTTFEPKSDVNRGQMATFIGNLLVAGGVSLPDSPPDAFKDDDNTQHEKRINQLAALGVVEGDEDGRYNPHSAVTRAQMASFLNRAYEEITGAPLTSSEDYFTDDEGAHHEDNINAVAGAGIAAGKTASTYAPAESVKRDQMATFLARETDLLVEKGKIDKPVTKKADVKLITTTVEQGGTVKGSVDTAEGVTIQSAKVSGCGLTERTLTLTGDANAFEFDIPLNQPTGQCKLTFTFTLEGGETATDEETITVTAIGSQTQGPELASVTAAASGDTVEVTYTFDENLNTSAGADRNKFKLYSAAAQAMIPSAATISGASVKATFTKAQYDAATTAAVAHAAVEDGQSIPNPEGAKPVAERTNTAGVTAAPDLIDVLQDANRPNVRSFRFDEGAWDVGPASNYHLAFSDGTSAAGEAFAQGTASARQGEDFRDILFSEAHFGKTIVRGWIDQGTVSDEAQDDNALTPPSGNVNPLQAAQKPASDPRPHLVKIEVDASKNQVHYTFDRGVSVVEDTNPLSGGNQTDDFTAYQADGSEVRSSSASASGSTVTATFTGDPDPITAETVGAGVVSGAVRSNVNGQTNHADELPTGLKTPAGRTAAPDLLSVSRSTSGSNTVLTYTFDQPVSPTGQSGQGFTIYQEDGTRREMSFNATPSANNTCSANAEKVVCTAATSSDTGAAMASAVLGGVEANTVDDPNNPAYTNYETSLPIR